MAQAKFIQIPSCMSSTQWRQTDQRITSLKHRNELLTQSEIWGVWEQLLRKGPVNVSLIPHWISVELGAESLELLTAILLSLEAKRESQSVDVER